MTRAARIVGAGVLTIGAVGCVVVLSAVRSDFLFRGCGDIPRAEWSATANCSDAWFGLGLMAGLALGLGLLAGALLIGRRERVA